VTGLVTGAAIRPAAAYHAGGRRGAARIVLAAGALILSGVLLAGCTGDGSPPVPFTSAATPATTAPPSPAREETTMTPDESEAELVDLFTATIANVGGSWQPGFTTSRSACTTANGAEGLHSQPMALGSGFESPRASAQAVAAFWTASGHTVTTAEVSSGEFEVTRAGTADGLWFRFGVTTLGSDLSGTSTCSIE
jgi:hypothetical protein